MEEMEIEVNKKNIKIVTKLPKGYIEDNNLKILLDDTLDLEEVIDAVKETEWKR